MTFIYERDPYRLKMYMQTKNELSTLRLSKVIVLHTDRHTYLQPPKVLPHRFAGGKNFIWLNKEILFSPVVSLTLLDMNDTILALTGNFYAALDEDILTRSFAISEK